MRTVFLCVALLFFAASSHAQKAFIGVAKYRMAMVGGPDEDSTTIVFDKTRILQTMYGVDPSTKTIGEMSIMIDFAKSKQYIIDRKAKSYAVDTFINSVAYPFTNTQKTMLVKGGICFHYKAEASQINDADIQKADCLAAIDYMNENIKDLWLMGFLPIIVDNRIVMDLILTEKDGSKPRVYISEINARKNVDEYFDLTNYKAFPMIGYMPNTEN